MSNFTSLTVAPAELANAVYAQVAATARTLGLAGTHIVSRTAGAQVELLVSRDFASLIAL